MEDEIKKEEEAKQRLSISFKWFMTSVWEFIREMLSIRKGADIPGTVQGIKEGIVFKGYNAWILVFSILIASIGLNLNSAAVVIGAMLISPLMGPIIGAGLALGTNDINTFFSALRNLLLAVGISLLTSFIYFKISPFDQAQAEIIARTKPQLLDALIAIFGGLAGIIGVSRKEKSNVIPGVAIATALMPPLCTAGYGLAVGKMDYFLGAFYLFWVNATAIAATSLIVVRWMRFPIVHFVKRSTEIFVKIIMGCLVLLVLIPGSIEFYHLVKEENFDNRVGQLKEGVSIPEGDQLIDLVATYNRDGSNDIQVFLKGNELTEAELDSIHHDITDCGIKDYTLVVTTSADPEETFRDEIGKIRDENTATMQDFFELSETKLEEKEIELALMRARMEEEKRDTIQADDIETELLSLYDDCRSCMYAPLMQHDSTIVHTFIISWKAPEKSFWRVEDNVPKEQIKKFLEARIHTKDVKLVVEKE